MSAPGGYKTPFWATLQKKDKVTLSWLSAYTKHWAELRISTRGDNEVFLSLMPHQGAAPTEEASLVGGLVELKAHAQHAHYCEVALASKRTIKLAMAEAADLAAFVKALEGLAGKGVAVTRAA